MMGVASENSNEKGCCTWYCELSMKMWMGIELELAAISCLSPEKIHVQPDTQRKQATPDSAGSSLLIVRIFLSVSHKVNCGLKLIFPPKSFKERFFATDFGQKKCEAKFHNALIMSRLCCLLRNWPNPSICYSSPKNGYLKSVGVRKFSLMVLGETQRSRFQTEPALSFVPEARAPPNGCCPTTAPVGLSLM